MFSRNGDTWLSVVKQLNADRSEYLEDLIVANTPESTEQLRGKIQMIDEIISNYPDMIKEKEHTED